MRAKRGSLTPSELHCQFSWSCKMVYTAPGWCMRTWMFIGSGIEMWPRYRGWLFASICCLGLGNTLTSWAGVGDPQMATEHAWYPGELACSSFERLAATQAALYQRVVGSPPTNDEQRVLAAWLWRNTHYWHGEQGVEDLWNEGFRNDTDSATREYWTGLFSHGFGLCGTTHAQWTAEMERLLGHNRARVVGVSGHNSFEVFLTGGAYGAGRWVLLDHDVSTVIFDQTGTRLLSIDEIRQDVQRWTTQDTSAAKQRGWLVSGLHPQDGLAFDSFRSAEYLAGYAGPPPLVHLRRGETLRRYLEPGLEDGRTCVYWGRNYRSGNVPGPERSRTWVNQPEKMYGSQTGAGHRVGQTRYANAVFTYRPDFESGDYREAVVDESPQHVTFGFQSPYTIAAAPAGDGPWDIYEPGCRLGLVLQSEVAVPVSISTDRGRSWHSAGPLQGSLDLTDQAKGHRQYWLKFDAPAAALQDSALLITTVCQANPAVMPRLTDHGAVVRFEASGYALESAGPNLDQAEAHRIAGSFDSPRVTLQLAAPRGGEATRLFAAAHVASSNPPSPTIQYAVDYSTDGGRRWQPVVKDWQITRPGNEPEDFWSQSFCWGDAELNRVTEPVQVRFRNDGGKRYRRAELHLQYALAHRDAAHVQICWSDDRGTHTASHLCPVGVDGQIAEQWQVATGANVTTHWIEFRPWLVPSSAAKPR